MNAPAYHLRPNKAADRFAFIDAINLLARTSNTGLKEYTYFGLGGPYLEDFRLLYEFCTEINMVSFEIDPEVYNRQLFHRPNRKLKLRNEDIKSFINLYQSNNERSVFWLDYTRLEYEYFQDFETLLGAVAEFSMVKISLRADNRDYWQLRPEPQPRKNKIQKFRDDFADFLPKPEDAPSSVPGEFAELIQNMLRIASQEALDPLSTNMTFVPVTSFYYADGGGMFTLTGVVCDRANSSRVRDAFSDWNFANLSWAAPRRISVPILSTQERLHLQRLLPTTKNVGKRLRKRLGYLIEANVEETEDALEQYAAFHRYSPYFIRGVP